MTTSATSPKLRPQFYWRGLHVPFITPWTHENWLRTPVVRRIGHGGEGLGYADEHSTADRRHGDLWIRYSIAPGRGQPSLAGVHPLRQRQAMSHMLCQVCGMSTYEDESFERWGERHLFIRRSRDGQPITEGEVTMTPPVCLPCAQESVRNCPHLRKGYAAALVRYSQRWGIGGLLYDRTTLRPDLTAVTDEPGAESVDDQKAGLVMARFTNPRTRWMLAARQAETLHGVTPIKLEDIANYMPAA
ncbi:hypothetical protein ACIOJ9_29605 [Streptomyces sp. NPDC088175]|uniref:hypothetical protein n=1 Tax=unclassified Streptomyces TaxID=2593676 RepID=UPI0038285646